MNWRLLLTLDAARDPELAPHVYLLYLLFWTFFVGIFVLFIFPVIGNTAGFFIIGVLMTTFVSLIWYFHKNGIFAD
jgi:uncharacterized membrane-anchored protein YitT (DUF2179 family)|tara:strand:- start:6344 stop:6571 length:228 start_codon:yes stop_codon:yes gene_type:complete